MATPKIDMSKIKSKVSENKTALGLAGAGAVAGFAFGGPPGALIGAIGGAVVGIFEEKKGKTSGSGTTSDPTTDNAVHLIPIKEGKAGKPSTTQNTIIHLKLIKEAPPAKLTPAIIKDAADTVLKALPTHFTNDSLTLNHQVVVAALQYLSNNPTAANLAACINTLAKNSSPESQEAGVDLTNYTLPEALKYWKS